MFSDKTDVYMQSYDQQLTKLENYLQQHMLQLDSLCAKEELPYLKAKFQSMLSHIRSQKRILQELQDK